MTRIAAVQTSSSQHVEQNLERVHGLLTQAREQQCAVVVLPECFAFMQSSRQQLLETAEEYGSGPIQDWLSECSRELGLWIIAGSLPLKTSDPTRVTNTLLVYDDSGICVKRYDKIYLFDVTLDGGESYRESDYTMAGEKVAVVDTPAGMVGLSICYDLRFPELYRELAGMGAQMMVVPSAFSASTGREHWLPLLRSRAIENTSYVIAPAQFGAHNKKRRTWGHTLIIDPWGKVLEERKSGWGLVCAEIDPSYLEKVRSQMPTLGHMRPDLF